MTLWSFLILLPSYTVLHEQKYNFLLPDISLLSSLTLADSLANPQIIWLVLIFTFLYTCIAYYTIITFSSTMSVFEFSPQEEYLDAFVAQHSIMIRGINKHIGVDTADKMILKVFEERFGAHKIIAVHTIRKTDNVASLFRKR